MNGFESVAPVTIASAFAVGMVLALLGSIKLALVKRLALNEVRVGGLLSALSLALIPMMLISGILVDHLGVRGVLLVGSLVTALALFGLAMSQTYTNALGAILLAGAGLASLSSGGSVLMPVAFFPDNPSASANLGNVFFGLGALVTPKLADLLIHGLGFRRALSFLAIVSLAPALLASLTARGVFPPPAQPGDLLAVLSNPILWLTGLAFFLYMPLEGSIGTWATTYLTELGVRETRAAWLLSGFWLTFLAARLITAVFQSQGVLSPSSDPWLLVLLALASAICLGNMAGGHQQSTAMGGLLLVGALFGPVFPTLVGILFGHTAEQDRGTAYGAMFAIGASGGLLLPPLIGSYARRTSVRHAMRIPVVVALALAGVMMFLALSLRMFGE
ncbi:MAG: MFS transporter [Gemmataceae bacterium]|nr:MFS transporter [Gemmataceae bacterium]